MNTITLALAAAAVAGLASTSAFAFGGRAGGPDPSNPVQHTGAYANYNHMVVVPWVSGPAPSVPVSAMTGTQSPTPTDEVEQGRG